MYMPRAGSIGNHVPGTSSTCSMQIQGHIQAPKSHGLCTVKLETLRGDIRLIQA